MDIQTLAQQLTLFLAPFLPYLLKAGEKAVEEVGEKIGEAGWEQAQDLWDKLRGKEKVVQVAETAAALPDNPALQEALREEIARALREDPALAAQVARLWGEAGVAGVTVTASGDRSVAIGGDVSGSTIVTGDRNVVRQGKYNVSIGEGKNIAIGDHARVDNT